MQRSPTNEEINAAETGNPESVDFRYSNPASNARGDGTLDLEALEAESPDNAQPGRVASAVRANCGGMTSDARYAAAGDQR